jgi:uncharacterized protein YdeI (YjbR/CyaY-like superfamily)
MPSQKQRYHFEARLSEIDALFIKTVIFVPEEVIRQLPTGRLRVKGTMNGSPFALAIQHMKDGSRYFSVSAPLRKAAGIKAGDKARIDFKLVDPDLLEIPEELEAVLAQDDQARIAWEKLTTGYQRSLIHYVTSVKNVDSRINRAIELLEKAKAGLLHGQKKKK